MADKLKDYEVTEARFIGGQHRAVGDPIQMTERAAKYYVAPHGTGLKAVIVTKEDPGDEGDQKAKKPSTNATGKPGK